MLEPDDLGPALPVLKPRRAWVGAVALVMVLTLVLFPYDWAGTIPVDTDCPSPLVRDSGGACLFRDQLSVLTNDGQDRAALDRAIEPFRGRIVLGVDAAGIYSVQFPVENVAELAPIKRALERAGFSVGYEYTLELYARN